MKYLKKYLLILLSLLYSSVHAETIYCKATWISDGDTFTCTLAPKQKVTIRLYQIDAPEIGQNHGRVAQKALSELIQAKPVAIQTHGQDKYGRTLGTIYYPVCPENKQCPFPTDNINQKMLELGMVWYDNFDKKNPNTAYQQAEQKAHQNKLGIWQQPKPIPPWKWRQYQAKKKNK